MLNRCVLPGPAPRLMAPNKSAVLKAEISLTQAIHAQNSEQHLPGISERDARRLLQWIAYYSRIELITLISDTEVSKQHFATEDESKAAFLLAMQRNTEKFKIANCELSAMCTPAQSISSYAMERLGLERPQQLHSYRFYGDSCIGHDFVVLCIPVIQRDKLISPEPYLIDVTYRQFFAPDEPTRLNLRKTEMITNAGFEITKTQEGQRLANTLLRNGYVKLDEKKAELYLSSLADGRKLPGSHLAALLDPEKNHGYRFSTTQMEEAGIRPTSPLRRVVEEQRSR